MAIRTLGISSIYVLPSFSLARVIKCVLLVSWLWAHTFSTRVSILFSVMSRAAASFLKLCRRSYSCNFCLQDLPMRHCWLTTLRNSLSIRPLASAASPMYVNSTPYRVHFAHATFTRVWVKTEFQTQGEASTVSFKRTGCRARASCPTRTRHCWRLPPFSDPKLLTSLLLPPRGDHQPPDPRTAGLFGRVATQSPLTIYFHC